MIENDPDDESRLNLTINRKLIVEWLREQWRKLRYGYQETINESKKGRGFRL